MRQIDISKNEAGQRLDKLLFKYLNQAPKSFVYKMLRKKNIVLNEKKADGSEMLNLGDEVKMYLAEETIEKFSQSFYQKVETSLEIVYEDDNILIINKPVGMLSQKAKPSDISAVEQIISYLILTRALTETDLRSFKPGICNRLDRNTSGLLVAGKSLAGLQEMAYLFKERSLQKFYLCVVRGTVLESGHFRGYLVKDRSNNQVMVTASEKADGAAIETEYRPLYTGSEYSLLEVHLLTGKTHQIRAHLAAQGHPLIGDYKYGDRKVNDWFKKKYGLESQLLHAYRLCMPKCEGVFKNISEAEWQASLPELFQIIVKDITDGNMEF